MTQLIETVKRNVSDENTWKAYKNERQKSIIESKSFSFERVEHFKYLGRWLNENMNSHKELKD